MRPTEQDKALALRLARAGRNQSAICMALGISSASWWQGEAWQELRQACLAIYPTVDLTAREAHASLVDRVAQRVLDGVPVERWEVDLLEKAIERQDRRDIERERYRKLRAERHLLEAQLAALKARTEAETTSYIPIATPMTAEELAEYAADDVDLSQFQ